MVKITKERAEYLRKVFPCPAVAKWMRDRVFGSQSRVLMAEKRVAHYVFRQEDEISRLHAENVKLAMELRILKGATDANIHRTR